MLRTAITTLSFSGMTFIRSFGTLKADSVETPSEIPDVSGDKIAHTQAFFDEVRQLKSV